MFVHRCLCVFYRDNEDCGCFWCVDRFKRLDLDFDCISNNNSSSIYASNL